MSPFWSLEHSTLALPAESEDVYGVRANGAPVGMLKTTGRLF
jgi:hypothetical protein